MKCARPRHLCGVTSTHATFLQWHWQATHDKRGPGGAQEISWEPFFAQAVGSPRLKVVRVRWLHPPSLAPHTAGWRRF